MNFYNPVSNLPEEVSPAAGSDYHESIASYHLAQAAEAIAQIKKIDPVLAKAVADAVMHALLAANAYNHDMFQRSLPDGEDFEAKIRKNR